MYNLLKKISQKIVKIVKWHFLKKKLKQYIKTDGWYFSCSHGIGDTYIFCSLIDKHYKKYKDNITIFIKKSHEDIPKMFGLKNVITIKNIALGENNKTIKRLLGIFPYIQKNRILIAHPSHFFPKKIINKIGLDNIVFSDLFKKMLNIPNDTTFEKPQVLEKDYITSKKILKAYNYTPNKTVILAPDAYSVNTLRVEFWQKLKTMLEERGFKILWNKEQASSDLEINNNLVKYPLRYLIPMCELCGSVISIRSGLCDLLSTADIKLIIIYPNEKWLGGTIYQGSNLKKMGLSNKALEIIHRENDEKNIINQILNFLN